jgi:hypothetical protein
MTMSTSVPHCSFRVTTAARGSRPVQERVASVGLPRTRAYGAEGAASTPAEDIAVGLAIREYSDRGSIDLDPEQQGVSMIFGLTVCLVDNQGQILNQGQPLGGGAMYQPVLTDLEWGDISSSPFRTELKRSSQEKLSIKFKARIVGTIGRIWRESQPTNRTRYQ